MTKTLELVHPRETLKVLVRTLVMKCNLFADDPVLAGAPYIVRAPVSVDDFRQFVLALEDKAIEVTNVNFSRLSLLCNEFRFAALSERLSAFRQSADFAEVSAMEDSEARLRLSALEERLLQCDAEFALLQSELSRQSQVQESTAVLLTDTIARLSRIEAQLVHAPPAPDPPPKATAAPPVPDPVRITHLSVKAAEPAPTPPVQKHTAAAAVPAPNLPPALGSVIISNFPEIFGEFRGKRFSLLWRGGRDGFGARDFHSRCDGHANTLTLIEDTDGNIFGGFTPLMWESREWNWRRGKENNCVKADTSLRSFIFTLKNPHNVPARRFALKAEKKDEAINCRSDYGPIFGSGTDLYVYNNCNANAGSGTFLGSSYTPDTGLNKKTFFTGSPTFKVKEIEVFEITD
jgi:hypothetical protein